MILFYILYANQTFFEKMNKWDLIKKDIDRYISNPEYQGTRFSRRKDTLGYVLNLLKLFFDTPYHSFRTLLYYRIGEKSKYLSKIFKRGYNDTPVISCPNVDGGGDFFYTCMGNSFKLQTYRNRMLLYAEYCYWQQI